MIETKKLLLLVLAVIAIIVGIILFIKFLGGWDVPPPYGYGDLGRFMDYLSCSYAMCIVGCDTEPVRYIQLEEGLSCNDMCLAKAAANPGDPDYPHLCGSPYALEFTFAGKVRYKSNYKKVQSYWYVWERTTNSMRTDIMRYKHWNKKIYSGSECFQKAGVSKGFKLDGFQVDLGCSYSSNLITGTCEGMLRGNPAGCQKGSTQQSSPLGNYVATGHIWIDPALAAGCEEFLVEESLYQLPTGTKYYGNCTFGSGLTVDIWTELDSGAGQYCAELVVCST